MKDKIIDKLLDIAIEEDLGDGDHTSLSCIPKDQTGKARLIIKQNGILAGVEIAGKTFAKIDPSIQMDVFIRDGEMVKKNDVAFHVHGNQISILQAERLVLNIMQRMSGIATQTNKYVKKLKGLKTRVLDTRKTTPGLRFLEKEAVRLGGGTNHRTGLFDMILIKDNHIDFAGGIENAIKSTRAYLKNHNKNLKIEVEARSMEDVSTILRTGGVHRILLDNFTPELTKQAVKAINGLIETESSGNITLENIREYAVCGVDYISVGALTHQIKSLDMSLKAFD